MNEPRIAAVILAAGTSSRMGTAKQLLRLGDTTLLGQVIARVRAARIDEIVLVLGHDAARIQSAIDTTAVRIVTNESFRDGMASSLSAGLAALGREVSAAFIVLADQPFVRPETLDILIERFRASRPVIVVPMYNGARGNPVLLDRSIFPEVLSLRGDVGARAIFGNHQEGIAKVAVDDPGILLDFDNQEDWENFQRRRQASTADTASEESKISPPRPPRTDK
jgi:molybdenum cofactor cytidylyltransferase